MKNLVYNAFCIIIVLLAGLFIAGTIIESSRDSYNNTVAVY